MSRFRYSRRKKAPKKFPYCTIPRTIQPITFWSIPPEAILQADPKFYLELFHLPRDTFIYIDPDTGERKTYPDIGFRHRFCWPAFHPPKTNRYILNYTLSPYDRKHRIGFKIGVELGWFYFDAGDERIVSYAYLYAPNVLIPYAYWSAVVPVRIRPTLEEREKNHTFGHGYLIDRDPWCYRHRSYLWAGFGHCNLGICYCLTERWIDRLKYPHGTPKILYEPSIAPRVDPRDEFYKHIRD
ncbi:hypothetical protein [uncultured Thermanaerothrix sp.]|uniref:hypothetical protein n=1 Tax=uncultured Thermanaerothrix sp. TaxID=1195149 RepID=UPI00261029E0|nr:hypothetical protein [uncultured Thermanaerothrix sp.]